MATRYPFDHITGRGAKHFAAGVKIFKTPDPKAGVMPCASRKSQYNVRALRYPTSVTYPHLPEMGEAVDPFELLLSWLSPDRDAAGEKLAALRRRLVVLLDLRGCPVSEDLADEAILRFVHRLPSLADSFADNDPISYLYVTACNLHIDYIKGQFMPLPDDIAEMPQPDAGASIEEERFYECLDECLGVWGQQERETVLDYYRWEKGKKIEAHKSLALRLGISANALRIKVYHLRNKLHTCIEECLGLKPAAEME
jgi:DNA-directed RNA polymerase specialized sigma24 family protein